MNCYECDDTPPADFCAAEQDPSIIRVDFGVSGSKYGLVTDRDVPFTLSGYFFFDNETDTYTLESEAWQVVTLGFDADLDPVTGPIASFSFPVLDPTVIDPGYTPGTDAKPSISTSERWQGMFPVSELKKLTIGTWVMATLKGDDNTLISKCAFYVLGG
jgi:hypothetical protein